MLKLFGRFVGVVCVLLGAWLVLVNLVVDRSYTGATLVWIVASGVTGLIGGVVYLLTFDGPPRWRNRYARLGGWAGMLFLVSLPSSLSFFLMPLVLIAAITLFSRSPTDGLPTT